MAMRSMVTSVLNVDCATSPAVLCALLVSTPSAYLGESQDQHGNG